MNHGSAKTAAISAPVRNRTNLPVSGVTERDSWLLRPLDHQKRTSTRNMFFNAGLHLGFVLSTLAISAAKKP